MKNSKCIRDYLYYFLGCEVITTGGKEGKLVSVSSDGTAIVVYKNEDLRGRVILQYALQPKLRPLSSITKDEVADLMGIDGFIKEGNWCSPFFQISWEDLNYEQHFDHKYIHQLNPDNFHFLLSLHFDLFNLIKSGFAIDATKQKEESL